MPKLATNSDVLRKRLRRLLGEYHGLPSKSVASHVLPLFEGIGKLALVGGAPRDVARSGVQKFRSDFDFVLHSCDREAFYALMKTAGATPNKFGGFGLQVHRWKVDVWALEDTWAQTVGVRKVEKLPDLLDCTFFNFDAIIFDLATGSILTKESYFSDLSNNILEINLEENPNPRGSLLRALRRIAGWQVVIGPKLRLFLQRELPCYSWQDLVELDKVAFTHSVLSFYEPRRLWQRLNEGDLEALPFRHRDTENYRAQLELPLA